MQTLIKNVADLKLYLGGVQKDMSESVWMPFVKQGEQRYIISEVGEEMYDHLCTLSSPNPKEQKLIEKLQLASAHYASLSSVISMILSTGDIGVMQTKTPNSNAVTKWMYVAKIDDARDKADAALENALNFLYVNASSFSVFIGSSEYKELDNLLVKNAEELSGILSVPQSQRFFNALKSNIKKNQNYYLKPRIGANTLIELLGKNLNEVQTEVKTLLQYSLANRALADSILLLNISQDFRVISKVEIDKEDDLSTSWKSSILNQAVQEADKYLGLAVNYLQKNASNTIFPAFFNSNLYKSKIISKQINCEDGMPLEL